MEELLKFVGEWIGTGEGLYPTIESFTYKETTRFTHDGERNQLHFDQRTMRQTAEGIWIQSHWECGFLFLQANNVLEMCNVQSGGRFEKLRGLVTNSDAGLRIPTFRGGSFQN